MKIPKVSYISFRSKRNFGIELEYNQKISAKEIAKAISIVDPVRQVLQSTNYEQDYGNTYWHVKFDRSCGDVYNQGGWEVASYKANGYKDLQSIGNVVSQLKKLGVVINAECGFHIHAECVDIKQQMMASLVANWLKIENVILESLPKHRRNNKYALPLTKRFNVPASTTWENLWNIVRPQRFDHPNRRVSLNLCNYAQNIPERKTIELRLPEGTAESSDVKNWVRLFINFIDANKRASFPKLIEPVNLYETMKIIGLHNEDPFFILSRGMRETKMWFARRIIANSSKRALCEEAKMFLNAMETKNGKIKEKSGYNDVPRYIPGATKVFYFGD